MTKNNPKKDPQAHSNQRQDTPDVTLEMNKMGAMPVGKLIFSMSLPAMFSMVINALYNIVNSIFVGMIGESALTAVTLIFPIQMLMISFGVGTGIGLNSLIARRLGEGKREEASLAASHGLFLSLANWVMFALFGLFLAKVFVSAFSTDAVITRDATAYCTVVTVFSLFSFVQLNTEKILQATGNTILPMISGLTGAICNVILDPILIFGLLGAPKLGVVGAAIGTVISQCIAMILGLIFLLGRKHEVVIQLKGFKLNGQVLKNIYSVGLPSILMQSIGSIMIFGLNAILITFSNAAVAVLGIYFRLQSFIFMPVFGLSQGAMPIFGYNYGAKKKERLVQGFKITLVTAIGIMAIGVILFQTIPGPLLKMFNASPEMLHIGIRALRTISLCFVFSAIGIICSTLFQATGHGVLSLYVSLLRQLILILPLAWLLARFSGLDAVWFSFPMAEIFSLTATILFFRYIYKKEIKHLGVAGVNNADEKSGAERG